MRHGVAIGSVAAVLLFAAGGGVVFYGSAILQDTSLRPQPAALGPSQPPSTPTRPDQAAESPAPIPPSFDVVKVSPAGTAVIAGRAEPGAKVVIRDGEKAIGEVTADR